MNLAPEVFHDIPVRCSLCGSEPNIHPADLRGSWFVGCSKMAKCDRGRGIQMLTRGGAIEAWEMWNR